MDSHSGGGRRPTRHSGSIIYDGWSLCQSAGGTVKPDGSSGGCLHWKSQCTLLTKMDLLLYLGKKGKVLVILVVQPEVQVRQVAMKFASTVFAPDHVPSRYLLLLAAGDP